ncbi:MAG: aminoacyl-tRNA hydrolase [Burkholderiaceae bacterium]|nr:MAG: aminoacyl-tRNA hydrolase [Burkholderiaceae bacterium]
MSSDTPIRLIVGLGNPGPEYETTRHNAGFWLVDALAQLHHATLRMENKFHGTVARLNIKGQEVWLLQPQTYMNRSGQAVAALMRFYKIVPDEILVAHDELDLAPGVAKLKQGGGAAGHNGLKDIIAALGTQDFWRLRIGIGHPRTLGLQQEVVDFVLHRPGSEQQQAIEASLKVCAEIVPALCEGEFARATMQLHTKV